jgi:hypothetical protein
VCVSDKLIQQDAEIQYSTCHVVCACVGGGELGFNRRKSPFLGSFRFDQALKLNKRR